MKTKEEQNAYSLANYHKHKLKNREKANARAKKWRENNKEKYTASQIKWLNKNRELKNERLREHFSKPNIKEQRKNYKLINKFGITLEDYKNMWHKQDGKCAICAKDYPIDGKHIAGLAVDHCHVTGKVRSLLCHKCNWLLGCAEDNIEILIKGINYLKKHKN